jgi:hypothetical protein
MYLTRGQSGHDHMFEIEAFLDTAISISSFGRGDALKY